MALFRFVSFYVDALVLDFYLQRGLSTANRDKLNADMDRYTVAGCDCIEFLGDGESNASVKQV